MWLLQWAKAIAKHLSPRLAAILIPIVPLVLALSSLNSVSAVSDGGVLLQTPSVTGTTTTTVTATATRTGTVSPTSTAAPGATGTAVPTIGRPPAPASPPDGTKFTNLGPLLKWSQDGLVRWVQLQVTPVTAEAMGIDMLLGDATIAASGEYQIKEPNLGSDDPNYVMLPNLNYAWRVRTSTLVTPQAGDWSPWSTPFTFITAAKTAAGITPVAPANGGPVVTRIPTLQWTNPDKTVFYYEIQVSRDPAYATIPGSPFLYYERHGGLTNPLNSYGISAQTPLEPAYTYYWRIRPKTVGDALPVAWSTSFTFITSASTTPVASPTIGPATPTAIGTRTVTPTGTGTVSPTSTVGIGTATATVTGTRTVSPTATGTSGTGTATPTRTPVGTPGPTETPVTSSSSED